MREGMFENSSEAEGGESEQICAEMERQIGELARELKTLAENAEELRQTIVEDEFELAKHLKGDMLEGGFESYLQSLAENIVSSKRLLTEVESAAQNSRVLLEALERQKTHVEALIVLKQNRLMPENWN